MRRIPGRYIVAIPHRFSPEYVGDECHDDVHVNIVGSSVLDLATEIDKHVERRGHQWARLQSMRGTILALAASDEGTCLCGSGMERVFCRGCSRSMCDSCEPEQRDMRCGMCLDYEEGV